MLSPFHSFALLACLSTASFCSQTCATSKEACTKTVDSNEVYIRDVNRPESERENNEVEENQDIEAHLMNLGALQIKTHATTGKNSALDKSSTVDAFKALDLTEKLTWASQMFHIIPSLVAAFRLELWDAIPVQGGATFNEIVQRTNSSAKGMDALLGVMLALGAVTYDKGNERFYNEYSKAAKLQENAKEFVYSPSWKIDLLGWSVSMQRQLYYLADSVREGHAAGLTEVLGNYSSLYEARADNIEIARDWDPWMNMHNLDLLKRVSFVYDLPAVVARIGKGSTHFNGYVLDFCGNDGQNAIRLARSDPTMKLTVLDLPAQVEKAARNIEAAGLQKQIDTIGVDLLDGNPTFEHKYDAVFMIHMSREWSAEYLNHFFEIIFSALNPGGVVMLYPVGTRSIGKDFEQGSLYHSAYPLYFLGSTTDDEYQKTGAELVQMLNDVGFVDANFTSEWAAAAAAKPNF